MTIYSFVFNPLDFVDSYGYTALNFVASHWHTVLDVVAILAIKTEIRMGKLATKTDTVAEKTTVALTTLGSLATIMNTAAAETKEASENLAQSVEKLDRNIEIIRDSTRKPLETFEDIFATSFRMLQYADDDLLYVNFVCGFGLPHRVNKSLKDRYPGVAAANGLLVQSYDKAVEGYFALLIDKAMHLDNVKMTFLSDRHLELGFFEKLEALCGVDYKNSITDLLKKERDHREVLLKALQKSERSTPRQLTVRDQIPWQLLLCRSRSIVECPGKGNPLPHSTR